METVWKMKPNLRSFLLIVLALLLIPTIALAWSGKVVAVLDGDTIEVMHDGRAERIRLQGIDCPEKNQPFGTKAKQFTSDLVFGKMVEVKPVEKDRYGRTIGWITAAGQNVNEAIVAAGFAWHYKQYSKDQNLADAEKAARQSRLGLWTDPNPIPPWDFRHGGTTQGGANKTHSVQSNPARPAAEKVSSPKSETVYHGNTQSRKFHRPGCRYYDCGNCTAVFKSRDEAVRAGYVPCKVCNP